jgi:hypothetical protein
MNELLLDKMACFSCVNSSFEQKKFQNISKNNLKIISNPLIEK